MLTLGLARISMQQHTFSLSQPWGLELGFIGLGRIGMVEKMVDEVEGRSYYGGSRVQVVHKSRDEGATNSSFEKLHESSLFLFKT